MKTYALFLLVIAMIVIPAVSIADQQDRIEELVKQLNSNDPPLQERAAKELAELKDERATKDLMITIKTGNYLAKKYAIWALGEIQDPRSIDSLRDALGDTDKYIVLLAKSALNRFGHKARDSLKEGLKSKSWRIRMCSAELLAMQGDNSGVDTLLEALRKGGHEQIESLKLLSMLNDRRAINSLINALIDKDRKIRKKAMDILEKWMRRNPEIIPDVLSSLKKTDNLELKIELISSMKRVDNPLIRQEMLDLANDPEVQVRLDVIQLLSQWKNKENIPVFLNALKDKDENVRKHAAVALSEMKVKEAIKPLIQFLKRAKETDPFVINAISNFGHEVSPEILLLLKDSNKMVRFSAAQVLGVIGSVDSVENLINALKDSAPEVRAAVAKALGKIGDKRAIPHLINAIEDSNAEVSQEATYALMSMGSKTMAFLTNLWQSGDTRDRQHALSVLGKIGDEKSLNILKTALSDRDIQIRVEAAQVLAAFGQKGVNLLLKALSDTEIKVRQAAINSLGEIKDPRAVKPLLGMINSEIKADVLKALTQIGSEDSLPAFLSLLKDKDSRIRSLAAEALGEIGDRKAAPALITLLSDKDNTVKLAAAEALGKLGDPAASRHLISALSSGDIRMRRVAAQSLGLMGDKESVQPLLRALADEDTILRKEALTSLNYIYQRTKIPLEADEQEIKTIISLLDSPDEVIRIQARDVLVYIGSKAVDLLMEVARIGDRMARIMAINILGEVGDQRASVMLIEFLEKEDEDIQRVTIISLGKLKEARAVTPLIKKLRSKDWHIRANAAWALGQIGDNKAVAALVRLLNDDVEKVRKSAGDSLERLTGERCPLLATLAPFKGAYTLLFVLMVAMVVTPTIRRRMKPFNQIVQRALNVSGLTNERVQWWLALFFGIAALSVFLYCIYHEITDITLDKGGTQFLENLYIYTLEVFPFFVGGCLISGLIMKYFSKRNVLPKSMLGTSTLGALIPLCSCGAVPMTRAMLSLNVPKRAVIAFLIVTPVLNPFVIFLSYGVIGLEYTILRIAAVFILAISAGLIIERLAGPEEIDESAPICRLCKSCVSSSTTGTSSSGLVTGWRLIGYLNRYIIIGLIMGALFATYMPAIMVSKYLGSNILGLFLAVTIGIPIFLCSGEEIVMLKPLLDMGLPMGHAIAFTIAANGICISSIAVLFGVLGRKTTALLTLFFWIGSFILGYLINVIF